MSDEFTRKIYNRNGFVRMLPVFFRIATTFELFRSRVLSRVLLWFRAIALLDFAAFRLLAMFAAAPRLKVELTRREPRREGVTRDATDSPSSGDFHLSIDEGIEEPFSLALSLRCVEILLGLVTGSISACSDFSRGA